MFVSHHTLKWTRTCRSHGRHPHAHTAHFLLNRHTDASPDDLLPGGSRKVEEPFGRIDPDDVRPSADLPDRDPRNGLTDAWRVVPDDRLMTFEPGGLPKSWRISAVRRNAADLYLVVNDPMTGEPVEPDLMALLRDGCFDFDRSRETPEWQGF